jgi:hypothetical protein
MVGDMGVFFFLVVVVLGFVLRASCLLGRSCTISFCVSIFKIGSHQLFAPGLASNCDPTDFCLLNS